MTEYEHEVHLVIKFKTRRKIRSKRQLLRMAQLLEASGLNKSRELNVHSADRTVRKIVKWNRIVKE